MRRRLWILSVLVCGLLLPAAAQSATPKTQVNVHEECSSQVLAGGGVVLTTTLVMKNARTGRPVTVRFVAGWNVERLYQKARSGLVVRLDPGESARKTVTLKLASAPGLEKLLRANKRLVCASTKTYTIP